MSSDARAPTVGQVWCALAAFVSTDLSLGGAAVNDTLGLSIDTDLSIVRAHPLKLHAALTASFEITLQRGALSVTLDAARAARQLAAASCRATQRHDEDER